MSNLWRYTILPPLKKILVAVITTGLGGMAYYYYIKYRRTLEKLERGHHEL
jgi:hypothetical protein